MPAGGAAPAPVEAVRITYDSSKISYRQILDVFFSVVHDPTEVNRQGPDEGEEYRSVVFIGDERERRVLRAEIDSLVASHVFSRRIATEIASLKSFRAVEESQQNFAARHPTDPYIATYDGPKLDALRRRFPQLYRR
jgi:peptide-methionine (S)-S-oxide reductase